MTQPANDARDYRVQPLRVVLVTSFAESHLKQDTLPELARRGVEIVVRCDAHHAGNKLDLRDLKERRGVELILNMHELGGHSDMEKLTSQARLVGLPIRALSRKKASWGAFLPPPLDAPAPVCAPPAPLTAPRRTLRRIAWPLDLEDDDEPESFALYRAMTGDPETRRRLQRWADVHEFKIRTAKLRDIVRYFLEVHRDYRALGFTERQRDAMILESVVIGRTEGVFPRLVRIKGDDIPRLVASIIRDEEAATSDGGGDGDGEGDANEGSTKEVDEMSSGPQSVEEHASPPSASNVPTPDVSIPSIGVELIAYGESAALRARIAELEAVRAERDQLRARVAELEKREAAFQAFQQLVEQGYMTPGEAAERLFRRSP